MMVPDLNDPDEMAAFAHEDPYWLDILEQGLRVADGFETEDEDAIIWRATQGRTHEQ